MTAHTARLPDCQTANLTQVIGNKADLSQTARLPNSKDPLHHPPHGPGHAVHPTTQQLAASATVSRARSDSAPRHVVTPKRPILNRAECHILTRCLLPSPSVSFCHISGHPRQPSTRAWGNSHQQPSAL